MMQVDFQGEFCQAQFYADQGHVPLNQTASFRPIFWQNQTHLSLYSRLPDHISSNNSRGAIISLFASDGGDYLMEVIISNIAHGKSCPKYFFTSNTQSVLNMDFNSAPGLVPWLIFRAWIVTDQFCLIRFPFNSTERG